MLSPSACFQKTPETPCSAKCGIIITGPTATVQPAESVWIDGSITLKRTMIDRSNFRQWLRSLFVMTISRQYQIPRIANVAKDQALFWEAIYTPSDSAHLCSAFRIELMTPSDNFMRKETHFVQVSARQYRSNILSLICG